jgi:hypothetical protein
MIDISYSRRVILLHPVRGEMFIELDAFTLNYELL